MTLKLLLPPPLVGLIFGLAMWLIDGFFPFTALLPELVRGWLSGALLVLAVVIDLSAILAFHRAQTTVNPLSPHKASAIVESGPYRFSRNPMYLGMALILTAWGCWLGQPLNLLLILGFVGYLTRFQIKPEEAILGEKFGQPYQSYLGRVRRWI